MVMGTFAFSPFKSRSSQETPMPPTEKEVLNALSGIQDPDLGRDIVSLGFVKDLRIEGGTVSFQIELTTPACPVKERFRQQATDLVRALPGVEKVDVKMTANVKGTPPSSLREDMKGVRNIVAVASGKGGVGKSTVALNLALALTRSGARVGLLDADVYGPSITPMLGEKREEAEGTPSGKVKPFEKYGLRYMSMGKLVDAGSPLIWRGPMASGILQQLLGDVDWGELDYLIVDLPPGTGDIQLTLSQAAPLTGAVIVTTPQEVASAITRKGLALFQQVNVPILGVVENMSGFVCPHCGKSTDVFRKDGGRRLSEQLRVPFLGSLPLDPGVAGAGDEGVPLLMSRPDSPMAQAYRAVAEAMAAEVSRANAADETAPVPTGVEADDPQEVKITFSDGKTLRYSHRFLRMECPCAECVDERTGEKRLRPQDVPQDVRLTGAEAVGRYAWKLRFSDGHASGLYTFETLRRLGE